MKDLIAIPIIILLLVGTCLSLRSCLPIECKECTKCGWVARWRGGLPGQCSGPCPKCGGFMRDCND